MFKNLKKNKKGGYTIIETMVAISVFLIVITIGMGALLNSSSVHNKSSNMRSIMDSLSFIMDDMSKNLRVGFNYHCNNEDDFGNSTGPQDCPTGGKEIFFSKFEQDNNESILGYSFSYDDYPYKGKINKSTTLGVDWMQLNPDEVLIDYDNSGFYVFGTDNTDDAQPFVVIKLVGNINYKGTSTPFSLQTSVSQRQLDRPIESPV